MANEKPAPSSIETIVNAAQLTRIVSTFPIGPDLAYFKTVHKIEFPRGTPENLKTHFADTVTCGFARPADIFAFTDDQAPALTPIQALRVAPKGFREAARELGFMRAFEKFQEDFRHPGDRLDDFREGRIDLDDILYFAIDSHMLFDRNHQVLPTGLHFDDTNGLIHNGAYHLDKVLAVLAKDPRITPVVSSYDRSRLADKEPVLRIRGIATCNSCSDQTIDFMFSPTADDMRAIWAEAQKFGTNYHPSTKLREAIFNLDLLGLRAAGAAKYDNFWASDEPSSDDASE